MKPHVKFCGLTRQEDIEAVNEIQPDTIGFVFYEKSRRYVSPEQAENLARCVKPEIQKAGVFVDAPLDEILKLADRKVIDIIQLHGNEEDDFILNIKKSAGVPVWKAFVVQSVEDIEKANVSSADLVLLDGGKGDGKTFSWGLLKKIKRPYILAGGLHAGNIRKALELLHPWGIDVSSGLETDGVKDREKMKEVIQVAVNTEKKGRFGQHGGQYIPETLMNAVIELEDAYNFYKEDEQFQKELSDLLNDYAGRPSRLYFAKKLSEKLGGAKIYLKREDLNHTGAHKINNVLGQALLAKKMGKTRLIAETGAGQHGVATATAAALLDMECVVFMGKEDMERQALNVYRMRLLGADVIGVETGTATLKDAVSQAMREWTSRIDDTHYCLGSVMGPHPFPTIVRDFQAVISKEIKQQILEKEGRLPDAVLACVGGGSNAIGTFYNFIEDQDVRLIGCEAAGRGVDSEDTAATIASGRVGIFHGMKSYFCQDDAGQIRPVYSISAGLDYPGIGPEHAMLKDENRAEYVAVTDEEAVEAFELLSRTEGIIPAIESAHAVAHALKIAPEMSKDQILVVTLSGRGDKDCAAIARYRGENLYE